MRMVLAGLLLSLATAGAAQTVDRSPRPQENPRLLASATAPSAEADLSVAAPLALAQPAELTVPEGALARSLRPAPRPTVLAERIAGLKAASNAPGLDLSSTPDGPEVDLAAVEPPTRKERRRKAREAASMQGSVCGVAAIKGEAIAPIQSKVGACGVAEPVRVTSVSGVRLSQAATVDCSVAQALNTWTEQVAQPAFDGKLAEFQIAAHYICRSRNNVKGAKVSEHGKGHAIDISAFVLSDGKVLTVAGNYNRTLRRIYKAACGVFKTTLGPGSDGYHEDHFHFDTAERRGTYCR